MNLPAQHLSDEAVAAYADGVLGATARLRAERHIASCPDCAYSVAVQREAVFALRGAPAPALPTGLLDRLRAVPTTTVLATTPPLTLSPDGSASFPSYGTPHRSDDARPMSGHPAGPTPSIAPPSRRHVRFGTVGLAAAVAVTAVATMSAGLQSSDANNAPAVPAHTQQGAGGGTAAVAPAVFDSAPFVIGR
jgi:anti-sigma factor RsiW